MAEFLALQTLPLLATCTLVVLGLYRKKQAGWRLILDLSFPFDHSVNDGIDKDEFSLHYCSIKHAIDLIMKTGKGALMGKVDIKSAYRIIPVRPSDRYLLGMRWRDKFYVDLALPFGLRSARVYLTLWRIYLNGF